jgi:hypothetical protein
MKQRTESFCCPLKKELLSNPEHSSNIVVKKRVKNDDIPSHIPPDMIIHAEEDGNLVYAVNPMRLLGNGYWHVCGGQKR